VANGKTAAPINYGEATAKKTAGLVAGDKKRAPIEYLGQEAWGVLDAGLQDKMCQVVEWACHGHVRALFAKWGAQFEMKELSPLLEESTEELASCLRIDGKVSSLNYQSSKLLQGGRDAVHYTTRPLHFTGSWSSTAHASWYRSCCGR
jgi:hypothetical protein